MALDEEDSRKPNLWIQWNCSSSISTCFISLFLLFVSLSIEMLNYFVFYWCKTWILYLPFRWLLSYGTVNWQSKSSNYCRNMKWQRCWWEGEGFVLLYTADKWGYCPAGCRSLFFITGSSGILGWKNLPQRIVLQYCNLYIRYLFLHLFYLQLKFIKLPHNWLFCFRNFIYWFH